MSNYDHFEPLYGLSEIKEKDTPATIVHRHKVALAFIGIGHFVVEKTQVDLSNAMRRRGGGTQREKTEIK